MTAEHLDPLRQRAGSAAPQDPLPSPQAELQRLQAQLREQQERLRAALRAAGTGTFRFNALTGLLEWDDSLAELLALPPGAGVGTVDDLARNLTGEDRRRLGEALCSCALHDAELDLEFELGGGAPDRPGGWLECKGKRLSERPGEASQVVGAITDISRRKQAELKLRENSERFRLALDAGLLGDWSWDAASDRVTFGPRADRIFGLAAGEHVTWRQLQQRLHPQDQERARLAVEHASATNTDYELEYRVLLPDGALRWVAARGRCLYAADGRVCGMLGVVQDITERKQSEAALRESEARLQAIFRQASVGIATATLDGQFQQLNRKFAELLGYSPDELCKLTFVDITHPEDRPHTADQVRALKQGEIPDYTIEKRYRRKSGEVMWSRTRVTLLRDPSGAAQQFIGVIEDITEHKRMQEALRQSDEFRRSIIDASADCLKTLSPDGTVLWINDRGLRLLDLSCREEAVGRPWLEFWGGEEREAARQALDAAVAGGRGNFIGYFPVDGKPQWWDVVITPINSADGRIERVLAVSRDITERVLHERGLREQARLLELLNQTGSQLASQLDLQTLLQVVTDAATQLTGAAFGAFFYNTVSESGEAMVLYTLCGAEREQFAQFPHPRPTGLFGLTFRGEGIVRCDDVTKDPRFGQWGPYHGMPPGHLPVVSYLAVPVISRSGEVVGGLFFGHPRPGVFTERAEQLVRGVAAQAAIAVDNARLYEAAQKAAEERRQLLDSERAARTAAERLSATKDEFLATLSHELRTPLSAILGWSQVLQRQAVGNPDLARGLEVIERNARVQTQLIEDLLDMSRITSGKLRLDAQLVKPLTVVEAAIETVRPAATAKGVRLSLALDPDAAPVLGDAGRLQQVIWNLLSNAIKFTPRDGTVSVRLQRREGQVEITVADTGAGIRPDFLPHVFDRFRQADASTTRRFGGLGLGLTIVRHLVELHGGTVAVHSAGEGQGASFTVQLPLATAALPRPLREPPGFPLLTPATAASFQPVDLSRLRILVVDDEPDARDLIQRVLSECQAHVLAAGDAEEALRLISEQRPDILISDIGMPETDGFQLLRAIRGLGSERGGQLPAIALTAFARPEDKARVLQAGFAMHVTKPVEAGELIAALMRVVRERA